MQDTNTFILIIVITTVEEHRSLGGSIIIRLDNGTFVGLIYKKNHVSSNQHRVG